mgnify:CR=1 FL=1
MEDRDDTVIFERQAQICKALSDPKRIMIIHALRSGEKTVSDLVEELRVPQANVSQHLAVMRDRGLVVARRRGNNVHYSLSSDRIVEACDIVRRVLVEQLEQDRKLARGLAART